MSIAALVRRLHELGASAEIIAVAVEAVEAEREKEAERKRKDAANTALYRARGGGKIPQDLRVAVYERDEYECVYCGSSENLQCDHDVPVSKGGETTLENLVTACRTCNIRKKDRDRKTFQRISGEVPRKRRRNSADPPFVPPSSPWTPSNPPIIPPGPQTPNFSNRRKPRNSHERKNAYVEALGPTLREILAEQYPEARRFVDGSVVDREGSEP